MQLLTDKTIFITGSTRGIGLAIASKCAEAQANIVILAKKSDQTPNFNSIIDSINKLGGKALAINMDVRDETAVSQACQRAVEHFGGIDVLINNVSSFCFDNTVDITMENFDRLFETNARATFLLSKYCHPYLKQSKNPHILNISPPPEMAAKWFKHHLAFTMSKFGMSMCTLGMAEEFKRDKIAVNSLWPITTIATPTISDHFKDPVYVGSRKPSIMADAAFEIICRKAKKCTGNFFIDELLLKDCGVTDFLKYAIDPAIPLIEDLFIPNQYHNNDYQPLDISLFKGK